LFDAWVQSCDLGQNAGSNPPVRCAGWLYVCAVIFRNTLDRQCSACATKLMFVSPTYRNVYATDLWAASEGIWVGCFSFIAVFMITVMGIAMLRTNEMQEKWKVKLAKAMDDENARGLGNQSRKYALFLLPLVTVLREGLEAVVFIGGVTFDADTKAIPFAVLAAVALGLMIGFAIYRGGNKMRLQPFFVGSTYLLLLVAAGLVSKGVAAFEAVRWNRLTGAQSDDAGTYDPRVNVWALKCCDPKQPDAGWWSVANALVGWSNVASYWTVGSYIAYWGIVIAWLVRLKNKKMMALATEIATTPLLAMNSRSIDEDEEDRGPYQAVGLGVDDGVTRRHIGYGVIG